MKAYIIFYIIFLYIYRQSLHQTHTYVYVCVTVKARILVKPRIYASNLGFISVGVFGKF
jgi:hypothetical protein